MFFGAYMVRFASPGDLHAFFFFEAIFFFVGKDTMAIPNPSFLLFLEQKFIEMVDFINDVKS